ncbi:hypothetical protein FHR83_000492 [Actinoplanes campanulatus]|uniref:Uncharacterized protein n=1 Tax=Actinoplanes campanulatus TaxID=113559 RepID=A0A7W5FBY6_9ACTN|nr:hypothetical protein [Actinoplanes campanulatus]MBB3092858.1 hypothetical protein [Actinoplanes campanulatus]GGM99476.1 hypothetical protein GCM10010109_04210 [Actinoplanes campanulatus]GID34044.1 hypothetical protein Aca09nite_05500 [Actinoplanes campanulatus]
MTRMRLAGVVLAALTVVGGVNWAYTAQNDPAPVWTTSVAAQQVLPSTVPAAPTSTTGAPEQTPGKAAAGRSPAKPHRNATPAPFIQRFAGQPGADRQKAKRKPATPHRVAPTIDGCDRNYGTIAQCVPIAFPQGADDRCAWLREHGFTALKVVGKDRQRLDQNRNKIACDG